MKIGNVCKLFNFNIIVTNGTMNRGITFLRFYCRYVIIMHETNLKNTFHSKILSPKNYLPLTNVTHSATIAVAANPKSEIGVRSAFGDVYEKKNKPTYKS